MIHAPMTGPGPSMSLGTSIAMEKMLAPAKMSAPVHSKIPGWPATNQCRTPSASAKKGSLRFPMNNRQRPAWTGIAVASKPTGGGLDEHVTAWFARLGVAAGGVVRGGGLPAVVELGEREAERHVGERVAVVVDVEAVDRVGVEPVALREGVRVHDQHGPVGVIGRGEHEEVGEIQAGVVAGGLEVGGTEVVRHGGTPLTASELAAGSRAVFTWSAWVQGMACGPPSITVDLQAFDHAGQAFAGLARWAGPGRRRRG